MSSPRPQPSGGMNKHPALGLGGSPGERSLPLFQRPRVRMLKAPIPQAGAGGAAVKGLSQGHPGRVETSPDPVWSWGLVLGTCPSHSTCILTLFGEPLHASAPPSSSRAPRSNLPHVRDRHRI